MRCLGNGLVDNCCGIEFMDEDNSNVTNNTVTGNYMGICLLRYSDNNTILDNEISDNGEGIRVSCSDENMIERNMIERNELDTGVNITEDSDDNEIHWNCFIDNEPQAWDNGTNNNWTGNYWSPPPGGPGNFTIPGSAKSKDNSPLPDCPLREKPPTPAQVPALTPTGIIALVGLLSVIAVMSIKIKRRK